MAAFPAVLLLGGCSGLGHFFGDTERLPGQNPNAPTGVSENVQRARGHEPATEAMLPEPGNVWPGPPQPLPTLGDVSRGTLGGGGDALGAGGGATLPRGGSMSMGEQNAVRGGAPIDNDFSGAGVSGAGVSGAGPSGAGLSGGALPNSEPDPAKQFRKSVGGGEGGSDIVIPNGDGTSTIISPDGSVKTVKGTPKP